VRVLLLGAVTGARAEAVVALRTGAFRVKEGMTGIFAMLGGEFGVGAVAFANAVFCAIAVVLAFVLESVRVASKGVEVVAKF